MSDVIASSVLALPWRRPPGQVCDEAISVIMQMRRSIFTFLLLTSFFFSSCSSAPQSLSAITVFSTPAATPWLTELFSCANDQSVVLNVSPENPDIYLRIGEPENLASPAYKIDMEEILIAAHRDSVIQNLTLDDAQALFAGQGDPSAQVWGYASDDDLQYLFDQAVMKGRSVSSFMRVAVDPQQMSDVLNSETNSVGILPRHFLLGDSREVFSAGTFPVLAITKAEPAGETEELIACLQK